MTLQHRRTGVGSCLLGLLILLIVPCIAHPLPTSAQTNMLDVARIDAFVRDQVQRHGIPGLALALVDGDHIVALRGFGTADQSGRPVTPQTAFVLASVSKPLTALATMQLVEAGKIQLDAPVQRYLPTFRLADPVASGKITVRQLLLHTSGIPVTACDTRTNAKTLEQYVAELQTVEPDRPVGTRYEYCSGNYNVVGRIIEVVAGQSFGSYMQQHIFAPLLMRHSFVSEAEARQAGLAEGYQWFFGARVPTQYEYNTSQLPSGFLIASAEDLAHFLIGQLSAGQYGGRAILSPDGIAAMQAPGVAIGVGQEQYGLGWRIGSFGGVPAIYHHGDSYNGHTLLIMEPQNRRAAVVLTNANGLVAQVRAFPEIEAGVARLLAGQAPASAASMSLGMIYLVIDVLLGSLVATVLWPLLRIRTWVQRLWHAHEPVRRRQWLRIAVRLSLEFGVPLLLLSAGWMFLQALGAQSWGEGLAFFPDFGTWLWAIALLMVLTGVIRVGLLVHVFRQLSQRQGALSPTFRDRSATDN